MHEDLPPENVINKVTEGAWWLMANIQVTVNYMCEDLFGPIMAECTAVVWSRKLRLGTNHRQKSEGGHENCQT